MKMQPQLPVFSASCAAPAGMERHTKVAFRIMIPVFLLCVAGSSYAFQTAPETPSTPAQERKPASEVGQAPDPVKMGASPAGDKVMVTAPVDRKSYTIGAEDVLQIIVWGNREISGSYTVRPDGMISVPLIKEIQASGKTPGQLEEGIAQALKDRKMVIDPNVTVSVAQVHSRKYYIQGEVNKPGAYDLAVPTTILEGLVNAGGFRDFAKRSKIRILRGSKELKFNYDQVIHAKHLEQNIMLEPGDQIIVP
jgi:polysaccharide export outer membrane protein